jgi:ketosteroid isomerase-like protein
VSEENVEIVKRAWEASLRHDNEMAESLYDPEVTVEVMVESNLLDTPAVYRGLDEVREFYGNLLGVFAHVTTTVEEWTDAGDNVVAVLHYWARGKQSGVPVEVRQAHVWTLREGKLWRLRIYPTKADALKALVLSE